ncbi:MAG: aromatic ring-hydroxylating dioxygenase subunit alpha [Nitrobacter vulgaris]|nr:aromatic ring-hydroxylating dioxygenase subunit alpha [Nitrobacter vulgaris]
MLFKDKHGQFAALEDRCCHRGAPLSLGWISDKGITCGYHGLEFDASGVCVNIPGTKGKIPERARVKSYPIVPRGMYLWIWMGDPKKARESDIVDYPSEEAASWRAHHDRLYVKANYVMLLENLMDLSHLAYLHKNSLGSTPEDTAKADMNVQSVFEYVAPSSIIKFSGAVETGTYDQGNRSGGHLVRVLHSITPETEKSSHYFFYSANGSVESDAAPEGAHRSVSEIFKEDAYMLEQQQIRLEDHDLTLLLDIPSDVARVQMVRFLERKLKEDIQQAAE